jgi:glyoxylase-like metal-dependent hydrolase (beta-lactamase superfamily II)
LPHAVATHPLAGITVLERGWLSSNNVLLHPLPGEAGATLVDTSHVNHAEQTLALVRHALGAQRLARVVNTHLHSDHCGGNATLKRAFGMPVFVPPGHAGAVRRWDADVLGFRPMGQRIEPFTIDGVLEPGGAIDAGGRTWEVIAAPGHDPHSVMLFDRRHGVLLSADALWQRGFGLVFPEIVGEPGYDDVQATLDLIAALPVRAVVPGHGAPFRDVAAALAHARERLAAFRADPSRHARHALKVMLKYHLMEERSQAWADVCAWVGATPLVNELWRRQAPRGVASLEAWARSLVEELVASGVLAWRDGVLLDV